MLYIHLHILVQLCVHIYIYIQIKYIFCRCVYSYSGNAKICGTNGIPRRCTSFAIKFPQYCVSSKSDVLQSVEQDTYECLLGHDEQETEHAEYAGGEASALERLTDSLTH